MAHPILLNQALAFPLTCPVIPKHVFFPDTAADRANEPDV